MVVDAVPNSRFVIPILNTTSPITWFYSANWARYGSSREFSPVAGDDTLYVVQYSSDTMDINPKTGNLLYDGILPMKSEGIYSLFLCGTDTSAPDFLFLRDSLPFYDQSDSVMGIRFVNLSATVGTVSVNLEGSPIGSEVTTLPYKGITAFKQYRCNSTTQEYIFVVRDAMTGDSLTEFDFNGGNSGTGLYDPISGNQLTFRNATLLVLGSTTNGNYPLATSLIDNFY